MEPPVLPFLAEKKGERVLRGPALQLPISPQTQSHLEAIRFAATSHLCIDLILDDSTSRIEPYQHCENLEKRSGNDKSPNPLKKQLSNALKGKVSRDDINQLLRDGTIDVHKINMPSYCVFKSDLKQAVVQAASRLM